MQIFTWQDFVDGNVPPAENFYTAKSEILTSLASGLGHNINGAMIVGSSVEDAMVYDDAAFSAVSDIDVIVDARASTPEEWNVLGERLDTLANKIFNELHIPVTFTYAHHVDSISAVRFQESADSNYSIGNVTFSSLSTTEDEEDILLKFVNERSSVLNRNANHPTRPAAIAYSLTSWRSAARKLHSIFGLSPKDVKADEQDLFEQRLLEVNSYAGEDYHNLKALYDNYLGLVDEALLGIVDGNQYTARLEDIGKQSQELAVNLFKELPGVIRDRIHNEGKVSGENTNSSGKEG